MKTSGKKAQKGRKPQIGKQNSLALKASLKQNSFTPSVTVVFETDHYVVVDKPAGLDCQNSKQGRLSIVDWLKEKYDFSGLVHRLDFGTSGLLVCAKNTNAAKKLTELLKMGKIDRAYTAIVMGKILPEKFIQKKENLYYLESTIEEKPASLYFSITQFFRNATLIEINLETGRKHQIRRQFLEAGYPLLGDHLYFSKGSQKLFSRPALHAHQLCIDGEVFDSPLPEDFSQLVNRLNSSSS